MIPIDSRNRDPDPPVILDPLVVLLSSRAVTAARGMFSKDGPDWVAVP